MTGCWSKASTTRASAQVISQLLEVDLYVFREAQMLRTLNLSVSLYGGEGELPEVAAHVFSTIVLWTILNEAPGFRHFMNVWYTSQRTVTFETTASSAFYAFKDWLGRCLLNRRRFFEQLTSPQSKATRERYILLRVLACADVVTVEHQQGFDRLRCTHL